MKRFVHCLLAVMLAFSTMAVTAHDMAHSDSSLEQCLLCATHAGANPAAVGDPPDAPVVAEQQLLPESPVGLALPSRPIPLPEPRAPPVRS
jgi:hypothetical protein